DPAGASGRDPQRIQPDARHDGRAADGRRETLTRLRRLWAGVQDLVPIYVIMVVIIAWNWHLQRDMFALGNLTTLLVELAPYILAAMAQTLVMLLGGVDLSVGAMISLASTLVATHL